MRSKLDELFLEADNHNEGHGAMLQDVWELDSAEFTEGQQRNGVDCMKHKHVCGSYICLCTCTYV